MKQHNRDKSILQHMIEHCDKIQKALKRFGDNFETFKNDDVLRDAVSMNLQQIGELAKKFSDEFSHRDFLGAIMNLGIDRSTIGDIFILENEGYVFCQKSIVEYIVENLDKVRHTHIKCERVLEPLRFYKDEGKALEITVTSDRIDVVLSGVYHVSRSESLSYFEKGIVYVNGRLCTSNAKPLKEKDVVNVRGKGKFLYEGVVYTTKKDKCRIKIQLFR